MTNQKSITYHICPYIDRSQFGLVCKPTRTTIANQHPYPISVPKSQIQISTSQLAQGQYQPPICPLPLPPTRGRTPDRHFWASSDPPGHTPRMGASAGGVRGGREGSPSGGSRPHRGRREGDKSEDRRKGDEPKARREGDEPGGRASVSAGGGWGALGGGSGPLPEGWRGAGVLAWRWLRRHRGRRRRRGRRWRRSRTRAAVRLGMAPAAASGCSVQSAPPALAEPPGGPPAPSAASGPPGAAPGPVEPPAQGVASALAGASARDEFSAPPAEGSELAEGAGPSAAPASGGAPARAAAAGPGNASAPGGRPGRGRADRSSRRSDALLECPLPRVLNELQKFNSSQMKCVAWHELTWI